jgi:hypothetical protein
MSPCKTISRIEKSLAKKNGVNAVFCLGEYPIFQFQIFSETKDCEEGRAILVGEVRNEEQLT